MSKFCLPRWPVHITVCSLSKWLGVSYNNKLKLSPHINNIVTKASLRAKLKCFQSRDHLLLTKAFCVFVRPLLEQRRRHGHKDGTAKSRRRRHENRGAVGTDPLPSWLGSLGSVVSSPSGSGAEPQSLANLVRFISYFMHSEALKFRFQYHLDSAQHQSNAVSGNGWWD